jgi:IS30 family transposase
LAEVITNKLQLDWSSEQISGYLRRADIANISYERIYQLILANKQAGGTLYTHLRYANKKRYGTSDRRGQIKNRVSIGKRPPMVADRQHIGDWEGNTIIGKGHQQAIVTLVDRATRLTRIGTITTEHAKYSSNNYS